jgi:hypothetical protein
MNKGLNVKKELTNPSNKQEEIYFFNGSSEKESVVKYSENNTEEKIPKSLISKAFLIDMPDYLFSFKELLENPLLQSEFDPIEK